jgi:hypothetical protein
VNVPPNRNTFRTSPARHTPDRAVIRALLCPVKDK